MREPRTWGGGGTLDELVLLHKHPMLVLALEVLDSFYCTIVFTCIVDYKRLLSSLLTGIVYKRLLSSLLRIQLLSRILTEWTLESHAHPFPTGKFSFTDVLDRSHSKNSIHVHHNLKH